MKQLKKLQLIVITHIDQLDIYQKVAMPKAISSWTLQIVNKHQALKSKLKVHFAQSGRLVSLILRFKFKLLRHVILLAKIHWNAMSLSLITT